jgi:hypothetical protein
MLIVSFVMLRSNKFGKVVSYFGIASGVLALVPPTVGTIGMAFSFASLIPMTVWLILIARKLLHLTEAG